MDAPDLLKNWRHDTDLRLVADGRSGEYHPRNLWRIGRRRLKRRLLEQGALRQPRFFCLNSGCCGSTYLIRLLADNGWSGVYHEKNPDFNQLGVDHFDTPLNEARLASLLRYTRWDVCLEANNRLFSLAGPLRRAFPGARFIHLFRDGRQAVRSALSRPDVEGYLHRNIRFQGRLAGDHRLRPLIRFCHYWNNMNRRILDDLETFDPDWRISLKLSFEDLVAGRLDQFCDFVQRPLQIRQRDVVNRGVVRDQGRYPDFDAWPTKDQQAFWEICGATMQRLGYPVGNPEERGPRSSVVPCDQT